MTEKPLHSTGRGGTGNIGRGEGEYADAAVLRDGSPAPKKVTEEHSTGRGGTGNILQHGVVEGGEAPADDTVQYSDYHTGRGGEGNVHRDKYGGHSKPPKEHVSKEHGFVEKAKQVVGLDKK